MEDKIIIIILHFQPYFVDDKNTAMTTKTVLNFVTENVYQLYLTAVSVVVTSMSTDNTPMNEVRYHYLFEAKPIIVGDITASIISVVSIINPVMVSSR